MTEIVIGKTYKLGRARYRVTKIEAGVVQVMRSGYLLSYDQERFTRIVERAAAEAAARREGRRAPASPKR